MSNLFFSSAFSLALASGCTAGPPRAPENAEPPGEEVQRYQAVLRELQAHADVAGARLDLERCDAWLAAARARQASDPGSADVRLYLDATAAVLVKVKSEIALRDAEKGGER